MSFFSRTSGAREAGTTTQPTRIFTGAVWARAGRPAAASAVPAAKAPRLNSRRSNLIFMTFPPVFGRDGYYLSSRRAIDRRQPKSGPKTGRGTSSPLVRKASIRRTGPQFRDDAELAMAVTSRDIPREAYTFDDVLLKPGLSD